MDGLSGPRDGRAVQMACVDANGDGRLNAGDGNDLSGIDVQLAAGACGGPSRHRDYFAGAPSDSSADNCAAPRQPMLIVVIGGGGTNLLDSSSGVSVGLLDIRNLLYDRAAQAGVASTTVLAAAAIAGADLPQTRMEQWLRLDLERRLLASPCLRAVLIGHSHGGVAVTSVIAALEGAFTGRLYGAVIDRSTALYDHPAPEMPHVAPLLNVFQLNEGWHGVPLNQPNVIDADESNEIAPKDPRVGREPVVTVTHTNLDDSTGVQMFIVERIVRWLDASRRD